METSPESTGSNDAARSTRSKGGSAGAAPAHNAVHNIRPVGSLIGDRFVVKAHLGRGRSDERYQAVDRSLSDPEVSTERCVVLHFLNARVAKQTRVLQKLETSYHQPHSWSHRNLFSVLGFGSDNGEYFFVTEELEGGTLRTILDEVAPESLSDEETFGVLSGIGDALKYAHAKGVVHGDIRAENIFVTRDLVVKVLDLLPATLPRVVPLFPEDNAAHGPAMPDPRDDVYGLACVAYELFAGKHPFNSNTALEALAAGLKPAPIPRLDARAWDALVRGLALRREQRTTSVAAFLAGLGVKGHERLRRDSDGSDAAGAAPTEIYESDMPRISEPDTFAFAPTARPAAGPRAASARAMDGDDRYELFKIRRDEKPGSRSIRWLALGAVLALGVSAAVYWDFAGLREHGTEWLAAGRGLADEIGQRKLKASPDGPNEPSAASPDEAGRAPSARVDAAPAGSAPPPASSVPTPTRTAPGPASSAQESANGVAPSAATPAPKPAPTPRPASPQSAATADATPSRATQGQPTAPVAEPPMPETFEPEQPVLTVSAAAPSAAITIRRHGGVDGSTTFVWWTSDGTAIADEDYINLGARIEKLAAGEQTRTIHVPIIHDPKRRGQGSFYVSVRPGQGKREDPAQRVEVVLSR